MTARYEHVVMLFRMVRILASAVAWLAAGKAEKARVIAGDVEVAASAMRHAFDVERLPSTNRELTELVRTQRRAEREAAERLAAAEESDR